LKGKSGKRMEKISWVDRLVNEKVLQKVCKNGNIFFSMAVQTQMDSTHLET